MSILLVRDKRLLLTFIVAEIQTSTWPQNTVYFYRSVYCILYGAYVTFSNLAKVPLFVGQLLWVRYYTLKMRKATLSIFFFRARIYNFIQIERKEAFGPVLI